VLLVMKDGVVVDRDHLPATRVLSRPGQ
jgi:hypothetical protein